MFYIKSRTFRKRSTRCSNNNNNNNNDDDDDDDDDDDRFAIV